MIVDNILMLNCLVLSGLIVSESLRKSSQNVTIFFLQNFSLNSIVYSVSQKNIPDIFSCNFRKHCRIFIIFGKCVAEKVSNQ